MSKFSSTIVSRGACAVLLASLVGCASMPGGGGAGDVVASALPDVADWDAIKLASGEVVVGFHDAERNVQIRRGGETIYNSEQDFPGGALSGIALAEQGERIWWAYRPKEPVREISVRSSDGIAFGFDEGTLALPRITLHPVGEDALDVFWTGERPVANAPREFAVSRAIYNDGLQGFEDVHYGELPKLTRLEDGRLFVVLNHHYNEGGHVSAWIGSEGGGGALHRVASRVASVQPVGGFASGNRMFAYWNNESEYQNRRNRLELAWSDDGVNWTPANFNWDPINFPTQVSAAGDGNGNLLMAVFASVPSVGDKRIERVKLYSSQDGGASWRGPFDARTDTFDYAKEGTMAVRSLDDGRFLLVWTDWRYVRPTLRYSVFDAASGEAIVADAPFAKPANRPAELSILTSNTVFVDNGVVTVVAQAPADDFNTFDLVKLQRSVASLDDRTPEPKAPDMKRLEQRVNAFGRAMVEKRFDDAYRFFDPHYRAAVPFEEFLKPLGRIVYKAYDFVEGGVQGVAGNAMVHIVAEVPAFTGPAGGRFEASEREMETVTRWLWMDGDWYHEHFSQALEHRFTRY